jgi:hypothetical protein
MESNLDEELRIGYKMFYDSQTTEDLEISKSLIEDLVKDSKQYEDEYTDVLKLLRPEAF